MSSPKNEISSAEAEKTPYNPTSTQEEPSQDYKNAPQGIGNNNHGPPARNRSAVERRPAGNDMPARRLTEEERNMQQYDNLKVMLAKEKKFSSRTRLFFGNVPAQATDQEIVDLFEKYGETKEYYVNREQSWGFIKMDYKINAEMARNAMDGMPLKGRHLRVKFASHGSAVEVHGLEPTTSNELLGRAFGFFGDVEKATVVCDMRGKPRGYGIVEFGWKKPAQVALSKVKEGYFILGRSPKPVVVKAYDQNNDIEGIRERDLSRNPSVAREREYSPRFARVGTKEYEWCERWKAFEDLAKRRRDQLEEELKGMKEDLQKETETYLIQQEAENQQLEMTRVHNEAQMQEEMRRRDEMYHREMVMSRQKEMEISRAQGNALLRDEMLQQEFRRQEEYLRRQQAELEMRKRESASELLRESAMQLQAIGGPGVGPRGLPRSPFTSPLSQPPRGTQSMMRSPFTRPPPPFGNDLGLPRPRHDPPPQVDGFFGGSKRPRMF